MNLSKKYLRSMVFLAAIMAGSVAWAVGFGLGGTAEQLQLKYDVNVTDHGTGRVTINLTIADEGNLKPLNSVNLVIPNEDGNGHVDLSVALATREVDGKAVVRVHLKKELAERAEIQLRTSTLDGKQEPWTWYYYSIRIDEHLNGGEQETDQ